MPRSPSSVSAGHPVGLPDCTGHHRYSSDPHKFVVDPAGEYSVPSLDKLRSDDLKHRLFCCVAHRRHVTDV